MWKSNFSLYIGHVEELLKEFDNVCTLRVQMPITSDLQNPRNFITKISWNQKMVKTSNNMIILDELLPISIEMAKCNLRGSGISPIQEW
jgi:UDP-glucose 4,6-dehydratase